MDERQPRDLDRYGPWAVIAGGSEGLGSAFAGLLAEAGLNLLLLARHDEALVAAADAAGAHGVEVRTATVDLSAPDALDTVRRASAGLEVGLFIHNAGANSYGHSFVDGELDRFLHVARLNTISRLELCHLFGAPMAARRRGGIMLVGSLAGFAGTPHSSVYNAGKAFSRVFAEGLWYELGRHDVHVVEFVVGAMRTPAMARRGMAFGPTTAEPVDVAREGLARIAEGPVVTSDLAGGTARAEQLSAFPRQPLIEANAANLRRLNLME